MNKTLLFFAVIFFSVSPAIASEMEQNSVQDLIKIYSARTVDQESSTEKEKELMTENTRLRSQLVDLRVERDRLAAQINRLEQVVSQKPSLASGTTCGASSRCVSEEVVEQEKIIQHIIYNMSLYRFAELVTNSALPEDVEAHKKAQEIMEGAKEDLRLLGFDTTDPNNFPTLDQLLEQLELAHGAHH